jgi:hypothetical protein
MIESIAVALCAPYFEAIGIAFIEFHPTVKTAVLGTAVGERVGVDVGESVQSGKVPQVGYAFWSVVPQPSKMERLLQSDSAVVPSNDPVRMVTDRTCKRSRGTFCLK